MLNLKNYKHIHCIGIGGIGLSAIAEIFLSRGYQVSGSDMKESEITDKLIEQGAVIYLGHRGKNIAGADLIVYSAAVSQDNPELVAAAENDVPTASRAEVLGALMQEYKTSIAIAGTHGKTTTTSMISLILEKSSSDPTILVGGNLSEINGNVKIGNSEYFVTEACEYMDSFLSLNPMIEIILNIDSDHLDYFKDIEHIVSSFDQFAKLVPENGVVIAYDANPFVNSILKSLNSKVVTFGFSEQCDYFASDIEFNSFGMPSFQVHYHGKILCTMQLSIPGEHNIANALAAFACCHGLGIEIESIVTTLEAYTGTQRRFDVIGITKNNIKIVDDYAHHPTEIKATLKAAQNVPHNSLWCLFQPHTYTRTLALFDEFAESFDSADKIVMAEIYAAREKNIYKISSKELVNEIKRVHPTKEVYYFANFDEIASFVINNAQSGDLVITMGAGDIYKVAEIILEKDRLL
ncbi:UDP-N-acetylmuramate--L-alanine ligase [Sinanaerobacter chloroacetimidivorans]|uniref:UDP-N-acetylmuramate--L-alanine ligase n=1 Tax=Sinanaerobacter chloroacetimidivorans TaxID=2818044 RepID=A0A8J8B334_9FIRM|nr:UDP-N-acetylmuramate--L-alanine ligase [Sinanaerobacter chloroacetimidivorans]MBR0600443.1 UDP-N-acetylmuramate--L-alanine ligase [Sinanaerobacter chloroacetimidivorans]